MSIHKCISWLFYALVLIGLHGCQTHQPYVISGLVYERQALSHAQIKIIDAQGRQIITTANALGIYSTTTRAITPPILVSAVAEGNPENCSDNSRLRPVCMAALLMEIPPGKRIYANINPLTDRVVSDIAVKKGFIGPQQWVDSNTLGDIDADEFDRALQYMQDGFSDALAQIGITPASQFNPASLAMTDTHPVTEIFSLIHHNRNYDNNTGSTGHTVLTDFSFRPIVGFMPQGSYEKFDLQGARSERDRIKSAKVRIFVVGDSTSAVYEKLRYPRMGWGQAFAEQFKTNDAISVIVGSRAGRSSRDFYNGRWFAQMAHMIQPGDYVFINHGHNDQNCNGAKPLRGAADVKNLCTYPNSTDPNSTDPNSTDLNNNYGKPQHPANHPELSFQHSLERYIRIVRAKGAHPVLFTPTARMKNKNGEQTTPVVHSHVTRHGSETHFLWTGDYTGTIRTTAHLHQVPLIDLETASMNFANQVGDPGWKEYWLVVDPAVNSFYATNPGSTQSPDGTHFQKRGAEAIARLVSEDIRKHPQLKHLAKALFKDDQPE